MPNQGVSPVQSCGSGRAQPRPSRPTGRRSCPNCGAVMRSWTSYSA